VGHQSLLHLPLFNSRLAGKEEKERGRGSKGREKGGGGGGRVARTLHFFSLFRTAGRREKKKRLEKREREGEKRKKGKKGRGPDSQLRIAAVYPFLPFRARN